MKKKIIISFFILVILSIVGNIFYNPTSTTIVESNTYLTPANSSFDDDNFYKCITDELGVSSDTDVTDEQLATITNLNCNNKEINSVEGLQKLINIKLLDINTNNIKNIDIRNNSALTTLYVYNNKLTSIDISQNIYLKTMIVDEDVEVIGETNNIDIRYLPTHMFWNNDFVFKQDMIKNGNQEFTVNVSNEIDKLAIGVDYQEKGHYYKCVDPTVLCGGYILTDLIGYASEKGSVSINGENINIINELNDNFSLAEEQCYSKSKPCEVYNKIGDLVAIVEDNSITRFYKDENEIGFIDERNMIEYIYLSNLNIGKNNLRIIINDGSFNIDYTINIIRSEKELNNNANEEFNEILDSIVKDNNINNSPNTGILFNILVVVIGLFMIGSLYYIYYRSKVKN